MSDYKSPYAENDDYMDEKEADSRMISMNRDDDYDESEDSDYKSYLLPQQVIRGMGLDLSRAPAKGDEKDTGKGIQETTVLVVFDLPDGSQGESFFKLGNRNGTINQTATFWRAFYLIRIVLTVFESDSLHKNRHNMLMMNSNSEHHHMPFDFMIRSTLTIYSRANS